ncbi:hypothetical protein ACIGNX_10325 [Actinosynnema sp. NPDC053489]|uniref:hypothetical protein n=1 Tax=Actinosynnema sp. NPDC053489 TaxID=3363916 RepID=UPI0037C5B159
MSRRPLPPFLALTVVLALVAGVLVSVAVFGSGRRVAGTAGPHCVVVRVLFGADAEMWRAARELRGDRRVREVRDERTQADNHARLTGALRAAGRDDLADAARVESTPASVEVVEAFGVDVAVLAEDLRQRYRVNVVDECRHPEEPVG